MTTIRIAWASTLVAAALLTTACTAPSTPDTSPSPSASADSGAGVEDQSAPPIVEQTVVPDPRYPDNTAEIGIQSLTVDGPIMTLEYVVTPDFPSESDSDTIYLGDAMGASAVFVASNLKLIDRANLKEYSVIYGDAQWWGTRDSVTTVNGTPLHAFAVFAAPEDDIDTVAVVMSDQFPEFTDVPITRAEK